METASDRRTGRASTTSICGTRNVPRLDAPLQRKCRSKVAAAADRLRPLDFVGLRRIAAASLHGGRGGTRRGKQFQGGIGPDEQAAKLPAGGFRLHAHVQQNAARLDLQPEQLLDVDGCRRARRGGILPAGGKAVAGPQFDGPARLDFFPSDCAQGRGELDLRAARRHGELKPRGGHAGNRQIEAGGTAAGLHGRPERQFQAILARLGDLQEQGAAVGFPFGLHGTIVELGLARLQADLFAAQGDPHAGRRVEYADLELRRQAIDDVPRLRRIVGQRRAIDGRRDHPALRLFGLQGGAAVKLGEERFGQEVLALGRLLLLIDGNEYRVGYRRRFGRLARVGRVPTAEHHGGKQRRAEGNDAGQGAGHLRAAIARPLGRPRSCAAAPVRAAGRT